MIPSSLTDVQAVLSVLQERRVEAVLFAGKFAAQSILDRADALDEAGHRIAAGGLSDSALTQMVLATLGAMGIEVLDQRRFLGPHLFSERSLAACGLTSRPPTESEWEEVRAGVMLARTMASQGVGQTVVRARGVTVAVEAAEGTDDTIRRGTRLAGPGAVVVKAVAPAHDFRFDVPAVGPATLQVMAAGRARVLAVERGQRAPRRPRRGRPHRGGGRHRRGRRGRGPRCGGTRIVTSASGRTPRSFVHAECLLVDSLRDGERD